MRQNIARRRRYRPFSLTSMYERARARDLTLDKGKIDQLIEDELSFLADTHAGVTYSLFERARRQKLCIAIHTKLNSLEVTSEGAPENLTNAEAGFVLGLLAESERRLHVRKAGELPPDRREGGSLDE
jgi:hypothetical protein